MRGVEGSRAKQRWDPRRGTSLQMCLGCQCDSGWAHAMTWCSAGEFRVE